MKTVKVHFLGAAGTVTGSKYILETPDGNIMVDCGVFQGLKELREHNWEDLPFDISSIDFNTWALGSCGILTPLIDAGIPRENIWHTTDA